MRRMLRWLKIPVLVLALLAMRLPLLGATATTSSFTKILLKDGITAPATKTGWGQVYVDKADGLVKIKYGAGAVSILDTAARVGALESALNTDHIGVLALLSGITEGDLSGALSDIANIDPGSMVEIAEGGESGKTVQEANTALIAAGVSLANPGIIIAMPDASSDGTAVAKGVTVVPFELLSNAETDSIGNGVRGYTPFPVRVNAPSVVCLCVDDGERWPINHDQTGSDGVATLATFTGYDGAAHASFAQYCGERGVPITYPVITGYIGAGETPGSNAGQTYFSHSDLLTLKYKYGGEIAAHGTTGTAPVTVAGMMAELRNAKAALEGLYGLGKINSYVFPSGAVGMTTKAGRDGPIGRLTQALFSASRGTANPYSSVQRRGPHFWGAANVSATAGFGLDSDANANNYIDSICSPGQVTILSLHRISDFGSAARLKLIVDHLITHRDAGDIALVTLNTACNCIPSPAVTGSTGVRNGSFEVDAAGTDQGDAKHYATGWVSTGAAGTTRTRKAPGDDPDGGVAHLMEMTLDNTNEACDLIHLAYLLPGKSYTLRYDAKCTTHATASMWHLMQITQPNETAERAQTIDFTGTWAAGDTWTLSIVGPDGVTSGSTASMAGNISKSNLWTQIQNMLLAAGYVGGSCEIVTGLQAGGTDSTVIWTGSCAFDRAMPLMTVASSNTNGGTVVIAAGATGAQKHTWGGGDPSDGWNTTFPVPITNSWTTPAISFSVPENCERAFITIRPYNTVGGYPCTVLIDDVRLEQN